MCSCASGADFPHFSVGSSFENHWRLFNARSPLQRSSLFQKGCDFQIYWVSLSTFPPLVNQIPSNVRLYSGSSACAALQPKLSPAPEFWWNLVSLQWAGSARPRWCQSHLLSLDRVYLSAPPLYFLKLFNSSQGVSKVSSIWFKWFDGQPQTQGNSLVHEFHTLRFVFQEPDLFKNFMLRMGLVCHRFTIVWISLDVLCHHAPCLKDLKKVMATSKQKKTLVWKETLWPKKIRQRENKCEATLCTKQPGNMKMDYIYICIYNK